MTIVANVFDFAVPPELEASAPPEERGLRRDGVRMMTSSHDGEQIVHTRFDRLPDLLLPGDVLVVNTSATLPAALDGARDDGSAITVHLSTRSSEREWTIELRERDEKSTRPYRDGRPGDVIALPGGGRATLVAPHRRESSLDVHSVVDGVRLWDAIVEIDRPVDEYLHLHGRPIRYRYVGRDWPLPYYQTVFAREPGSAEMPSAARPFTPRTVVDLVARGVVIVPVVLHTGVASLEDHEPPYEELFRVHAATAGVINAARAAGRRIIAVGTTVVRALESAAREGGLVREAAGWTDLVVTPERGVRVVDGILTGLHEPRATHLAMLEAIAGRGHLERTYREAIERRYLWHEFGDVHLILP
jgi:S-adenosylmethionine:tRNA ribosyltransferase-isomerase